METRACQRKKKGSQRKESSILLEVAENIMPSSLQAVQTPILAQDLEYGCAASIIIIFYLISHIHRSGTELLVYFTFPSLEHGEV